jgi:glycosyltransferase involved in cell wall biosynthesis
MAMKISVCLASYNGERYIAEQLTSILNQLSLEDELIISDDSSTDKTLSIIQSFQDSRIRIFPKNSFYNPIFNFENTLKQATGEVVVLSDQDDIWLDHKLEIIRNRFENKPSGIYTIVLDGKIIDDTGTIIGESIFQRLSSGPGLLKNILHNSYMGCCLAFSRELTEIILPFPKTIPMHDSWIGLLSELFGTVEFIPEKSIKYRKHETNKSLQGFALKQKICWRYFLMTNLFKRWVFYKKMDIFR